MKLFLSTAALAIDHEGRIIIWNKTIEEMKGIQTADMIDRGDMRMGRVTLERLGYPNQL